MLIPEPFALLLQRIYCGDIVGVAFKEMSILVFCCVELCFIRLHFLIEFCHCDL